MGLLVRPHVTEPVKLTSVLYYRGKILKWISFENPIIITNLIKAYSADGRRPCFPHPFRDCRISQKIPY